MHSTDTRVMSASPTTPSRALQLPSPTYQRFPSRAAPMDATPSPSHGASVSLPTYSACACPPTPPSSPASSPSSRDRGLSRGAASAALAVQAIALAYLAVAAVAVADAIAPGS